MWHCKFQNVASIEQNGFREWQLQSENIEDQLQVMASQRVKRYTPSPLTHYSTHYSTLHCTIPHYTTLCCTTLHYTTLHYAVPHYTTLHSAYFMQATAKGLNPMGDFLSAANLLSNVWAPRRHRLWTFNLHKCLSETLCLLTNFAIYFTKE